MIPGIILSCLAALLPAVMLYFPNTDEIPFTGMLPYFAILIGLGILAWAFMYLIFRRKAFAALTAAVWLLVLMNVGRLVPIVQDKYPLVGFKVFAPVTLVFLALVTFGLSRLKEDFLKDVVKVAVLAMAAFIVATAVPALLRSPETEETVEVQATEIDITPAEGTDRPNIYWILPDEYAGYDQLNKYYHYDNTPFFDELREMGFTVSEHSYNYHTETFATLGDIFSLDYVKQASRAIDRERALANPDYPLWTLLRSLGYDVTEAESKNLFRLKDRLHVRTEEDAPITKDGNAVANLLLQYSLFYRYENEILEVVAPKYAKGSARQVILDVFDWAENPENLRVTNPTFTMIYFMCPHSPFHFDRDGNSVTVNSQRDPKAYYLDQLIYTTKRVKKIIEAILEVDPDSIIVLQSDHGHRFVKNVTYLDMTNILNAVYFRGKPLDGITDKNGLNTWRAILREQFHLDLPEVEEKRQKNTYRKSYRDPEAEDPNEGLIP